MDKIIVQGVPPLDGEYTIDLIEMVTIGSPSCLTNNEAHAIKTRTGLRLSELFDAFLTVDNDVYIALADIGLRRLGKRFDSELLWDARVGAITIDFADREEVDESPPVVAPPEQTSEPSKSGGASGSPTLVPPANDPSPTGLPGSGKSAASHLLTSVT